MDRQSGAAGAAQAEADGDLPPGRVRADLHDQSRRIRAVIYLRCGVLSSGFARLVCTGCGFERLLPFSCKTRLCPSCAARRAADTAADLVDHLLPEARYRHWVLTSPWAMRFRLAVDPPLLSAMLKAFLQTLFTWQ